MKKTIKKGKSKTKKQTKEKTKKQTIQVVNLIELNDIKLNLFDNINFLQYNVYLHNVGMGAIDLLNIMKNLKYDDLCLNILQIVDKSKIINFNKLFNRLKLPYSHSYSFQGELILDFIKNYIKKNDNNLYFGCNLPILRQFKHIGIKTTNVIYRNEEYNDYFDIALNNYKKEYSIEYIEDYNIFKDPNNKYDNVFIKLNDFNSMYALPVFMQLKIPNFLYGLVNGLINLKPSGNLFYIVPLIYMTPVYKKIFLFLEKIFKRVFIYKNIYDDNFLKIVINCYDLKKDIDINDFVIQNLIKIVNKTKDNNYIICDFLHYYYENSINNTNNFMYKLNDDDLKQLKQINNATKKTKLMVINDIYIGDEYEINEKNISLNYLSLINEIEYTYSTYITNLNSLITKYVKFENNKITNIDKKFFSIFIYNQIISYISICTKYNIPYNKVYLSYINKYSVNITNLLHTLENIIKIQLVKTKSFKINLNKQWNNLKLLNSGYHFDELKDIQIMYKLALQVNTNILINIKPNKIPKSIKDITDNYARGIAKYINNSPKYKLSFTISNGFTKMWEILHTINGILPNINNLKVFFIAEAPGQWIYCIDYYIKKNLNNVNQWDWRATSLNPKHPENIMKYGNNIIEDTYGFIKNYPNNWLMGIDNTGDITKSINIKWYRQYVNEWDKPNLVTGDAGIQSNNPLIYQKLELAQVLMVASVSRKGGNCIIKHFLPYITDIPETEHANGFFINYVYLYYLMFEEVYLCKPLSSNPISGEFYLIGKNFIGIDDNIYNKLMDLIDNFQVNMCFFKKKDIPENFIKQVFSFIEKLTNMNVNYIDIQNTFLICFKERDEIIEKVTECRKYLDPKYIDEIQEAKFLEWIKLYNFK